MTTSSLPSLTATPLALHTEAMELAEQADRCRREGEKDDARELYSRAFDLSRYVANILYDSTGCEPTRSTVHRSAAWLALEAGSIEAAESLICDGMNGQPPEEIEHELLEVQRACLEKRCDRIAETLRRHRYLYNDEKQLQDHIERIFHEAGIEAEREYRLTARDIPDFFTRGHIAVEVKVQGSQAAHLRQLKRYADHQDVSAVVLVTRRGGDMPDTLSGKPFRCVSLWRNMMG
jgi:hypothetical protein